MKTYRPEDPARMVGNRGRSASPTRTKAAGVKVGGKGKGKDSTKGKKGKAHEKGSRPLAGRK